MNIDFNSGTIDLSTQTVDVTLNAAVDALNFDSNTLYDLLLNLFNSYNEILNFFT